MSLIEYYILAVIAFCVLGKGPKEVSEETDRDSTQVAKIFGTLSVGVMLFGQPTVHQQQLLADA